MSAYVRLFRIATDTPDYQADDLSGAGANATGGRWNRVGTPLVYLSSSRALACLETVVHLVADALPLNRYLVEITIPSDAWDRRTVLSPNDHVGWDAQPAAQVSLDWGTAWANAGKALIAEVPSVIVPEESNYLLNPAHSDCQAVSAVKIRKWTYDGRLGG